MMEAPTVEILTYFLKINYNEMFIIISTIVTQRPTMTINKIIRSSLHPVSHNLHLIYFTRPHLPTMKSLLKFDTHFIECSPMLSSLTDE
ncbi:unnamed protein product [Adineta ricciae]|uniref:Uncharacterized protein n=1 Tax=Adineta ricciae TaxID=249248 RepID=A0A814WYC1_ADIRI|nr:unnamed protein product [Adineta ricciae]